MFRRKLALVFSYQGTNSRTNAQVNVDPGAETPVEEVEDQRERSALFLSVTIIYYLLRWFPGPVFKTPSRLVKDHRYIFSFFKPPLHQQPRSLKKKSIGV